LRRYCAPGKGGELVETNTVETDPPVKLRNRRQVAEMLAVSERTVRRLVTDGELAAPLYIGRAARWREADVLDYVRRLSQSQAK
jgi:excisionase family DNA binding protein